MKKVKGVYINLDSDTERKCEILHHLQTCNIADSFHRFPAIKGDKNEALKRSLTAGELGIWQSWLSILKNEKSMQEREYNYLHIIEDDARLGESTRLAIRSLEKMETCHDIIFTDMYVNPSVYLAFADGYSKNRAKGRIQIISNIYTGCLSSCLIHKNKIQKVHDLLNEHYTGNKIIKPLDNTLRNLMLTKDLDIGVTSPLLTTVEAKYIRNSSIQSREYPIVSTTQEYCTILRKELSCFADKKNKAELLSKTMELIDLKIKKEHLDLEIGTNENELENLEIRDIIHVAEILSLLKYKYRENLIGDQNNDQNNIGLGSSRIERI